MKALERQLCSRSYIGGHSPSAADVEALGRLVNPSILYGRRPPIYPHTLRWVRHMRCLMATKPTLKRLSGHTQIHNRGEATEGPLVSIIIPVYNAAPFLDDTFRSILAQDYTGRLQVSAYDDGSTDGSLLALKAWAGRLALHGIEVLTSCRDHPPAGCPVGAKGAGAARNRAVLQSTGDFLCFLDADDIMEMDRVRLQLKTALSSPPLALIGSNFVRFPADSTPRYSNWLNSLSQKQIFDQRFKELTLIQPTWFCHRRVFDNVGGYSEVHGDPEDLLFFYKHIERGGTLHKVDQTLLRYRYHKSSLSWKVSRKTLLKAKVAHLEAQILVHWPHFSIWSAGRDGKDVYKLLSAANRAKVTCFWDIDPNKVGTPYVLKTDPSKRKVPILHWEGLVPPVVICVAMDRGTSFDADFVTTCQRTGMLPNQDYVQMV